MAAASATQKELQASGMLSRDQLIDFFSRFSFVISQPDAKKRIMDAVKHKQEAVSVTTAMQTEIFLEMGIDPRFGIACLGKVNDVYEKEMDLMIRFYRFIAKEEMAIDEAELDPDEFAKKINQQHKHQEQQLELLKNMRSFHPDDQSAILDKIHEQLACANFENDAILLKVDQMKEIIGQRTPVSRA